MDEYLMENAICENHLLSFFKVLKGSLMNNQELVCVFKMVFSVSEAAGHKLCSNQPFVPLMNVRFN